MKEPNNKHFEALNVLQKCFYENAKLKGFHSSDETDSIKMGNFLCNLHGEISELWEAYRANSLNEPCDKADKMLSLVGESLTCAEEELADICIRLLDTSASMNIDLSRAVRVKNEYNKTRPFRHGNKLA